MVLSTLLLLHDSLKGWLWSLGVEVSPKLVFSLSGMFCVLSSMHIIAIVDYGRSTSSLPSALPSETGLLRPGH